MPKNIHKEANQCPRDGRVNMKNPALEEEAWETGEAFPEAMRLELGFRARENSIDGDRSV